MLLLLIGLAVVFGGCGVSSYWSDWEPYEQIEFCPVLFSSDSSKIYFSRAFTDYDRRDYHTYSGVTNYEYKLKYRRSALYEMDLNTLSVREIIILSTAEAGTDTATSDQTTVFAKSVKNIIALRDNVLFYDTLTYDRYVSGPLSRPRSTSTCAVNLDGSGYRVLNTVSHYGEDRYSPVVNTAGTSLIYALSKNLSQRDTLLYDSGDIFENSIGLVDISSEASSALVSAEAARGILAESEKIYNIRLSTDESILIVGTRDYSNFRDRILNIELNSGAVTITADSTYLTPTRTFVSSDESQFVYFYSVYKNLILAEYSDANYAAANLGDYIAGTILTNNISDEAWGIFYSRRFN